MSHRLLARGVLGPASGNPVSQDLAYSKDSSGACSGGKFVVSKVGEEYDSHNRGLNGKFQLNSVGKGKTMLRTILIILLVLFLLGALPSWPYSAHWGYYPSGGLGLILIIVIILIVLDIV